MHHLKKAFTFVELIISISIIVLLAVIGITAFNGTSQKTSNAKVESDITTLKNAFLGYHQENATFPQPNGNNNYFT